LWENVNRTGRNPAINVVEKNMDEQLTGTDDRIVRERERLRITGVPRSTWLKYEKLGQTPKSAPLFGTAKGWFLSDLQKWIDEKKA